MFNFFTAFSELSRTILSQIYHCNLSFRHKTVTSFSGLFLQLINMVYRLAARADISQDFTNRHIARLHKQTYRKTSRTDLSLDFTNRPIARLHEQTYRQTLQTYLSLDLTMTSHSRNAHSVISLANAPCKSWHVCSRNTSFYMGRQLGILHIIYYISAKMMAYMREVVNKLRTNGRTECSETHCVAYCKTLPLHPIQQLHVHAQKQATTWWPTCVKSSTNCEQTAGRNAARHTALRTVRHCLYIQYNSYMYMLRKKLKTYESCFLT